MQQFFAPLRTKILALPQRAVSGPAYVSVSKPRTVPVISRTTPTPASNNGEGVELSAGEIKVMIAIAKLAEHFDSVRVFVSLHNGGDQDTQCYTNGAGNFYAQLGQVKEWVAIQDQHARNYAIKKDNANNEENQ